MLRDNSISIKSKMKIVKGKPDLTPLVDILFLLLIFFMLSSSFVQVSGVKVDLPEIETSNNRGIEKFVIAVDKNSNYFFNDEPLKWIFLKEKLLKINSNTIIIRADKNTPFGAVAKLMSLAVDVHLNTFVATVSPEEEDIPTFGTPDE